MLIIDHLVPENHLVRKLDAAIDFSFIYPLVEDLYSLTGLPSIDPVVLIKMMFIQYTFGIRAIRQTIKEIETSTAYRWFLGFGFYTEVPHFSVLQSSTQAVKPQKFIQRHIWEDYMELAKDLCHHQEIKC